MKSEIEIDDKTIEKYKKAFRATTVENVSKISLIISNWVIDEILEGRKILSSDSNNNNDPELDLSWIK